LVLAFVGGFAERLLPDMLKKVGPQDNAAGQDSAPPRSNPPSPPQASNQPAARKPMLEVTHVTKVTGPVAGSAAGLVRLIIEGRAISRTASFEITHQTAGSPGTAPTRIPITPAQLAPPGGVTADAADQDGDATLFRRLTIDIASVPPVATPPLWANDTQQGQRMLAVRNPDGQQVACSF
jgi:hypothetical protein